MHTLAVALQLVIAASILFVWIAHFPVVVQEFDEYNLPEWVRSSVGAAKIATSTLLVAGIWYPSLVFVPALIMAFLMLAAQYFHFKVRHPFIKYVPSFLLLLASLFVAYVYAPANFK